MKRRICLSPGCGKNISHKKTTAFVCSHSCYTRWRRTTDPKFVEQEREKSRRHRARNPKKIAEYNRQYRADNAERCRILSRRWYENHRDEAIARSRIYKNKHAPRYQRLSRQRRDRERQALAICKQLGIDLTPAI